METNSFNDVDAAMTEADLVQVIHMALKLVAVDVPEKIIVGWPYWLMAEALDWTFVNFTATRSGSGELRAPPDYLLPYLRADVSFTTTT